MDGWKISESWAVQQKDDAYVFKTTGKGYAAVPGGAGWSGDYAFKTAYYLKQGTLVFSFCTSQDGRYCVLVNEKTIALAKETANGETSVLGQADAPDTSKGHYIVMACKNGRIQVYVDKTLYIAYDDTTPLAKGTIAVSSVDGTLGLVDNVLVNVVTNPLPDSALPVSSTSPASSASGESPGNSADNAVSVAAVDDGVNIGELPDSSDAPPDLPPGNVPSGAEQPQVSFTISKEDASYQSSVTFVRGDLITLEWDVSNAVSVSLMGDPATMNGTLYVDPEQSTTYVLAVTGFDGQEREYTVDAVFQPLQGTDLAFAFIGMQTDPTSKDFYYFYRIVNNGDTPSPAFTFRWYPDEESNIVGFSQDISSLASGENVTVYVEYTYHQTGILWWKAVLDEENEVTETEKGNNIERGELNIAGTQEEPGPAQGVDLAFSGTSVICSSGSRTVTVKGNIANNGNAASPAFTFRWYPHEGSDVVGYSQDFSSIAAGTAKSFSFQYTYDENGAMHWEGVADADKEVSEINEGNNTVKGTVIIGDSALVDNWQQPDVNLLWDDYFIVDTP